MLDNKISYFDNGKNQLRVINNDVYVNNTLLTFIGSGVDGLVYKYKNKAIKLYHDDYSIKMHLSSSEIKKLSILTTKHIILPKELLINDNKTLGFTMNYINLNTKCDFLNISLKHLIKEIKELESELYLIGKNNFLLEDVEPRNLFYNGTLYLFDADSFSYDEGVDFKEKNIEMFVWCFIKAIALSLNNQLSDKEQTAMVRKLHYLYTKSNCLLLSEFLESLMQDQTQENIKCNLKVKKLIN